MVQLSSLRKFGNTTFGLARTCALLAVDSLCLLVPVRRRNAALTLRLDAVGDFFIWMQSGAVDLAAFARQSERHSVLVANRAWADYARVIGFWDEVIDVDPIGLMRNPLYRMRVLYHIRSIGAQILIQPRAARVFLQEDEIARTSGAVDRIGSAGTSVNSSSLFRRIGSKCYDRLLEVNQSKNIHETVRNGEFVRTMLGHSPLAFDLSKLHPTRTDDVISVALGAGQSGRVWPMKNYAQLLNYAAKTYPAFAIELLGARADSALAEELENSVAGRVKNHVGKTELREFIDSIARSSLVLCNDSSAFHIAMALKKNTICFLGGGHFGWFAPYPAEFPGSSNAHVLHVDMTCFWCSWDCKYPRAPGGAFRCVESISVQSAMDALDSILLSSQLS